MFLTKRTLEAIVYLGEINMLDAPNTFFERLSGLQPDVYQNLLRIGAITDGEEKVEDGKIKRYAYFSKEARASYKLLKKLNS